jgi:hypothetical protein
MALREIIRAGARFTWTNRQLNPIWCVLDRVFVFTAWEARCPLCSVTAVTRTGSDHNPLFLNSGEETRCLPPRFFFQTWWFNVNGFGELVKSKLEHFLLDLGPHRDCIDLWQCVARNLRQFLKGWGANLGKEKRLFKENLLSHVKELDRQANEAGLDGEGWALRYHLEDHLILLDRIEEDTGSRGVGCVGLWRGTHAPSTSMPSQTAAGGNAPSRS